MREISISSAVKKTNPYIVFFLLVIAFYLPSVFLRGLFYPDEARDLFVAKNMHTLADFLFPHYLGGIYYQKPPFYFWIIHLLTKIPLKNYLILPILFNILVSFAILSVNYLFFKKEGEPETGFLSSIIISTTVIFYGMSILVRMDILFLLLIMLSLYFLWGFLKEGRVRQLLLAGFFIFLSVFTKGAFGIVFPLFISLGMAVFLRGKQMLKRAFLANGLAGLLILVWLFAFSHAHPVYIKKMIFTQTLSRAINPFSHKHSGYYYLQFLIPLMLPWSFVGLGYFSLIRKRMFSSLEKLFILWFVGGFIILSAVSSKMPIYLLLLTVPFSALTAKFLEEGSRRRKSIILYATNIFLAVIFSSACIYFGIKKEFIPLSAYIAVILFFVSVAFMFKRGFVYRFKVFFIAWVIFIQLMNFLYLPLASRHYAYNNIAGFLEKADFDFSKVYVDEKKLLLLSVYPLKAEVLYAGNKKDFAEEKDVIFISKTRKPALFSKIAEVNNFIIFYR